MNKKKYLEFWAESYKRDLTENIMPFWMEHGWDRVHGGVYTCVDREGSLMDHTKSVWFQGRFAFICSYAYNNIEHGRNGWMLQKVHWTLWKAIVSTRTGTCIFQLRKTDTLCGSAGMCFPRHSPLLPCLNMPWLPGTCRMPRKR